MKKEIGYCVLLNEEKGMLNHEKLSFEFTKAGINLYEFSLSKDGLMTITFDKKDEIAINEIIASHNPTPVQLRPSQEELNAQAIEEIIAMLMEGDKYEI